MHPAAWNVLGWGIRPETVMFVGNSGQQEPGCDAEVEDVDGQ